MKLKPTWLNDMQKCRRTATFSEDQRYEQNPRTTVENKCPLRMLRVGWTTVIEI